MAHAQHTAKWYETRQGYMARGVLAWLAMYGMASWAIDSANMFAYASTFILLGVGIAQFVRAGKKLRNR